MNRIAIIGAGVSGLTVAQLLKEKNQVVVYEKDDVPGGLIKCRRVEGNLFHSCGGHVFNSKYNHVLDWFWSRFDREREFVKTERNSAVFMEKRRHAPGSLGAQRITPICCQMIWLRVSSVTWY